MTQSVRAWRSHAERGNEIVGKLWARFGQAPVEGERVGELLLDVGLLRGRNAIALADIVLQALNPGDEVFGVGARAGWAAGNFDIDGAGVSEGLGCLLRGAALALGADGDPAAGIDGQILAE